MLVNSLATLTGADVAASEDLTGNAALGGDWDLEYETGQIATPVIISEGLRRDWNITLNADQVQAEYVSLPIAFEQNNGQTDAQVDFIARGSGYSAFLTDGDAVLTLNQVPSTAAAAIQKRL